MSRSLRWILGGTLALGAVAPLHRLLEPNRTGPAGQATRGALDSLLPSVWVGTLGMIGLASLLGWLGVGDRFLRGGEALAERVRGVAGGVWAAGCGLVAGAGSASVTAWFLRGRTTLIDEMAQLRHARLFAEGRLAEPWPFDPAFRSIQNGWFTPEGWVSIYPPGHTALLAAGIRTGLHPFTGAIAAATAGLLTALVLFRLWPDRPATARLAGLAAAASPFLWGLGAGYLSHAATLAGVAATLWATLRTRDGAAAWALVAGLAAGWTVATRPWTGIALALLLPAGLLVAAWRRGSTPGLHGAGTVGAQAPTGPRPVSWLVHRVALAAVGGLPFAIGFGAVNARLFGSPGALGYSVAFGPSHGLGFHQDPWGNTYGLVEALAYSGADLAQLGVRLLETPVSLVLVVAVWLLLTPRLPRGTGVVLGWALLPVLANAAYWHHGIHRGPRMLLEAAPAWAALATLALAQGATTLPSPRTRGAVASLAFLALGWAAILGIPLRLAGWSLPPEEALPTPPAAPAVVFVHGSWASREVARLAARGMRRDSIETAIRRNDLCRVHLAAGSPAPGRVGSGLEGVERPGVILDFDRAPGSPPDLQPVRLSPGNVALLRDPSRLPPSCRREARADARGVRPLAPVLARVPPWSPEEPVVWVRDLGPETNRALLAKMPDRTGWVWETGSSLEEFETGMARIWGDGG